MNNNTDEILIKKALENDSNAFEQLIKRYQQNVFQICMGYAHDADDANDLTQEVFIKVYKNLSKFKFNSKFSTWIFRIAINSSINYIRKEKIKKLFVRIDYEEVDKTLKANTKSDTNILRAEEKMRVRTVLNQLSTNQRKAFILSQYQDFSNKEIAEIMQLSVKAVESLIFRARENLKKIVLKM